MQRRVGMADGEARCRTLGAVIKEKDEELALFLEMRRREKERGAAVAAADQLLLSGDDAAGNRMLLLDPPPPAGGSFILASSSGFLQPFHCILLMCLGSPSLSWCEFLVLCGRRAQTGGVQGGWRRI